MARSKQSKFWKSNGSGVRREIQASLIKSRKGKPKPRQRVRISREGNPLKYE